jgi:hypothetical protein
MTCAGPMAELADALDLGSNEATHAGSIPVGPTRKRTASGFPERESGGFLIPDIVSIMDPNFKPYRTGMVTVLERYPCGKGNRKGGRENVFYYCRCDCGNTFIVSGDELTMGSGRSASMTSGTAARRSSATRASRWRTSRSGSATRI